MKTILLVILSVLFLTSCNKKECKILNQQVQNQTYEVQNAAYNVMINNTDQSYNELLQEKQTYEQLVRQRDNICN